MKKYLLFTGFLALFVMLLNAGFSGQAGDITSIKIHVDPKIKAKYYVRGNVLPLTWTNGIKMQKTEQDGVWVLEFGGLTNNQSFKFRIYRKGDSQSEQGDSHVGLGKTVNDITPAFDEKPKYED